MEPRPSQHNDSPEIQIGPQDEVVTELGTFLRTEVILESGGQFTHYYPADALTDYGHIKSIRKILSVKDFMTDPLVIQNLEARGTTPEQFVEERAIAYIEDIRNHTFTPGIHESVLSPLIQQAAYARLCSVATQS